MHRRTLLTGIAAGAATASAGCLAGGSSDGPPEFESDDHQSHLEELGAEIERRDVELNDAAVDDGTVGVDYETSAETMNDDLAEVAMAFVERIQGGWEIDRLEAVGRGEAPTSWHAEAEWAEEYLNDEIDANEYGNKISETMERTLVLDSVDDESDAESNETDEE